MIDFIEAMRAAGVDPGTESIISDGQIHRFRGPGDKRGRENCWYVLSEHGGGAFGSWRLGISETWSPLRNGARKLSRKERRQIEDQVKAARRAAEAERKRSQD